MNLSNNNKTGKWNLDITANEPLKSIILVALNTGMRLGDIFNLEWDQVTIGREDSFITIKKSKARRLRRVFLNRTMVELFSRMQLKRSGSNFVFENPEMRKPFTTIRTAWDLTLKRAGIKDLRFHDLRHTFATYAIMRGGDLIHLKETLGHADIRTTARYAKAIVEGQKRLVEGIEVSTTSGNSFEIQTKKMSKLGEG